jgi:hypothetical protein
MSLRSCLHVAVPAREITAIAEVRLEYGDLGSPEGIGVAGFETF